MTMRNNLFSVIIIIIYFENIHFFHSTLNIKSLLELSPSTSHSLALAAFSTHSPAPSVSPK